MPLDNLEVFTQRLQSLLENGPLLQDLAQQAGRVIETHSDATFFDRWYALVNQVAR